VRSDYHGEIDVFLVYCPEIDKIYKVPVELTGKNSMQLRIKPTKSRAPKTTINWAADFEI
jgi:hypothetical protein